MCRLLSGHCQPLNGETNYWGRDRDREILKHFEMDESETETFGFSKFERDRDETESLLHLVSRPRRDRDETLTKFPDIGTSPRRDCLKYLELNETETETAWDSKYGRVRDETGSLGVLSLETETRPRVSPFSGRRYRKPPACY